MSKNFDILAATAGTVAAAMRFLAKAILTGDQVTQNFLSQDEGLEKARVHLTSDRGIGQTIIARFLEDVPGINDGRLLPTSPLCQGDCAGRSRRVSEKPDARQGFPA